MIPVRANAVRPDQTAWDEAPMLPIHALAMALAAVAGRAAYHAEDMADAARATVVLREAGVEVRPGLLPGPQTLAMTALAATLAWARLREPLSSPVRPEAAPRDIADAEWVRGELRNLGFDLVERG